LAHYKAFSNENDVWFAFLLLSNVGIVRSVPVIGVSRHLIGNILLFVSRTLILIYRAKKGKFWSKKKYDLLN